jgi:hypothetical protein
MKLRRRADKDTVGVWRIVVKSSPHDLGVSAAIGSAIDSPVTLLSTGTNGREYL